MDTESFLEPAEPAHLVIDGMAQQYLLKTAKWAKFLSLTGFAILGFAFIITVFILTNSRDFISSEEATLSASDLSIWLIVLQTLFLCVLAYPTYKMYRFADLTLKALSSNNSGMLGLALKHQLSMFQFYGIMTAFILIVYGMAILIGSVV